MILIVSFLSFSSEKTQYLDMMILRGKTILYIKTCIFNKASIGTEIIVQMHTWFRMVFACYNGGRIDVYSNRKFELYMYTKIIYRMPVVSDSWTHNLNGSKVLFKVNNSRQRSKILMKGWMCIEPW